MEINTLKSHLTAHTAWDKLEEALEWWGSSGFTEKNCFIAGYALRKVDEHMTGGMWSGGPEVLQVFELDGQMYGFKNDPQGGLKTFYEVEEVEVTVKKWKRKK